MSKYIRGQIFQLVFKSHMSFIHLTSSLSMNDSMQTVQFVSGDHVFVDSLESLMFKFVALRKSLMFKFVALRKSLVYMFVGWLSCSGGRHER